MMTEAGVRIMTELLTAELRAGRIRIEGRRVYRGWQEVEPRLSFMRVDEQPTTLAPLPAPPAVDKGLPESGEGTEEVSVTYPQFAGLPQNRLLPIDQTAQDRARMAQQRQQRREAAQTFPWPENVAPLSADVLTRKNR